MSNVALFPGQPNQHLSHTENSSVPERPDPEKLQRLLGQLVDALTPLAGRRGYHELRIRNFRSDKYALEDELIILLEERDGQYVANSFDTGQYGQGYSPDDAIQHLCSVLEDYYELLLEDDGHLSLPLAAHLRYLRSVLRARS